MTEQQTYTISTQEFQKYFGNLAKDYELLATLNLKDEDLRIYFEDNSNKPTIIVSKIEGYIFINKAFEKFSGFAREEILGKSIFDYTMQSKELIKKRMNDRENNISEQYESTTILKNGKVRTVWIESRPLRDKNDHFIGSIIVIKDIQEELDREKFIKHNTQYLEQQIAKHTRELQIYAREMEAEIRIREEAQFALLETDKRLRTLFYSSPDAVFVQRIDGTIIDTNEAFAALYGYTRNEVIGRHVREMLNTDSAKAIDDILKKILTQNLTRFEIVGQHKNGHSIPFSVNAAIIEYDKGVSILIHARDISERIHYQKELEEVNKQLDEKVKKRTQELEKTNIKLQRSNEELERFAYIASHDLQSPLKTIISFLQLLESRYSNKIGADGKEFIEYCVSASTRMRELISDILQYSRLSASPKFSDNVDVNKLLFVVIKNLENSIKAKNAIIHTAELPTIKAEPYLIVQLLQNIIDNAIKFVADKQPVILVSISENRTHWVFSITDNGIGISSEYKEKIFQIFNRLHTSSEYTGTGIGLAICKKVAELHQGKIWIDSEVGKGTTFHFTLAKNIA